ncbi:MAG: baseplate protein [Pelagibacteraceae bacterium]
MPLPKINTPTYELELPSNGKKIKYRPFLVREEKILLMALESEDMKQITDAVVQILSDCILTKTTKVAELSTFDIEYLFLNVRSRSVGETVEVNITCPDDGETQVNMEIALDSIKVEKNKDHTNIIKLDENLSMKLKYPSLEQFIDNNFETNADMSNVDKSLELVTSCIDIIYDAEESWSAADCTKKELEEFLEQLNTKQFKEIENFFTTMPKLTHTIKVKNPNTKVESEVVLEGLASFFS